MFNVTPEDFQKRQEEMKKRVTEKIISDFKQQYPLIIADYLRQHFPSDETGFLKYHTDIPADYSIVEGKEVFLQNYTQCTWTLNDGQIASFAYYVHPIWPLVLWFTYPQKDPNEPSIRTFEQVPDAEELATNTRLTSAEAVNLLEMTDNISHINQAAWMSLKGETFTAILRAIGLLRDNPSAISDTNG